MIQNKTISTVIASVILAVFAACSDHSISDIMEEAQLRPSICITIAMSGRSAEADSDNGFEEGVGLENHLDIANIDRYRIYFFDTDNKYISTFRPVVSGNVENPDGSTSVTYYRFQGEVPNSLPNEFKIVTLFNWPRYPSEKTSAGDTGDLILEKGVTTIEDLCTHSSAQFNALFTDDNESWLDDVNNRLIPFYGIRKYNLKDYVASGDWITDESGEEKIKAGVIVDLSKVNGADTPLPVIRAMAKVEVILDNPMASFEEVKMTKINGKGFCAPYKNEGWNYDYSDYHPNYDWDTDFVRGVHLTNGATADNKGNGTNDDSPGSLSFKKVTAGGIKPEKWVAYVPEYKNIGVEDYSSIRVKLRVADADNSQSYYNHIYFAQYDNGQVTSARFDIERNNIYRFTITGMGAGMTITADIQPFAEQKLTFGFGLLRDSRGDLMVVKTPERDATGSVKVDEKGDTIYSYPQYFIDFVNKNHPYPKEVLVDKDGNIAKDDDGNIQYKTTEVKLTAKGDYYAIVVGEYESLSEAHIWVKDKDGCHVLTNYGDTVDNTENSVDHERCNARLVESFFSNNQSEIFHKDKFGFRRVHHFDNHNSIVRHPVGDNLLFCVIENFGQQNEDRKYYEVESWDGTAGWIIVYDDDGNETGFRRIRADGTLGETENLNDDPINT